MRHTYMHLGAATAIAIALAAIPAASHGQESNPEVQVRGQSKNYTYFMDRKQVHEVSGSYQMSDGSILDVTDRERKLYVWLDGRRNELHAIAHNQFATRDRNMTLSYSDDARYGSIAVSYIPQARVAGGPVKMIYLTSK